jgi:hypothetical protein
LVERFFNKIKHCRRIATRYDKLAANYLDRQVTLPNRYAARLAEAASSSATNVGLFIARSARRRARSPALPGDTHLSFSLLALGVPDFASVCP